MDDMISRQAVINEMKDMYTAAEEWAQGAHDDDTRARAESCMATNVELKLRIEKLPSVQTESTIGQLTGLSQSTKDCISRKAAIDAITEIDDGINMDIYTNEVRELLREVPSVQPQRWIPVTESLPEENGGYLVTGKRGVVYFTRFEDERWYGGTKPIAWMPLPEPYKEKQNEDDGC